MFGLRGEVNGLRRDLEELKGKVAFMREVQVEEEKRVDDAWDLLKEVKKYAEGQGLRVVDVLKQLTALRKAVDEKVVQDPAEERLLKALNDSYHNRLNIKGMQEEINASAASLSKLRVSFESLTGQWDRLISLVGTFSSEPDGED